MNQWTSGDAKTTNQFASNYWLAVASGPSAQQHHPCRQYLKITTDLPMIYHWFKDPPVDPPMIYRRSTCWVSPPGFTKVMNGIADSWEILKLGRLSYWISHDTLNSLYRKAAMFSGQCCVFFQKCGKNAHSNQMPSMSIACLEMLIAFSQRCGFWGMPWCLNLDGLDLILPQSL